MVFVIEHVEKLPDERVGIIATEAGNRNIIVEGGDNTMLAMLPPQIRQIMDEQYKMIQKSSQPFIKFAITSEEYHNGNWKVGDAIKVTISDSIDR